MRILFVGVFSSGSTNVSQTKALSHLGHTVHNYPYRELGKSLGNSIRDQDLLDLCNKTKFDFVLFSKCNEINSRIIPEINKYSKTVLWYMDPFNGNFSDSLISKIQHCTATFCALREPYEKALGFSSNVFFLQEGFDSWCDFPQSVDKIYDVSFIGNLRGERKTYQDQLSFHNITDAYDKQHSKVVSQSKINLNFTEGGTSDRTYKILAAKGFLLTQPWPEMERDFEVGKDLDIFTSPKEAKTKIDYYLNNETVRKEIADSGYKSVQRFSRINWAKSIINKLYG